MKKYMYICLVVVVLLIIGKRLGKTDIVSELHGQWKVTEFLACKQYGVSYSYYDHFLGRSITITPEQIITSLNYWPEKIEYSHMTYDDYEVESIDIGSNIFFNSILSELKNLYKVYNRPEYSKWDGSKADLLVADLNKQASYFEEMDYSFDYIGEFNTLLVFTTSYYSIFCE